ncbi:cystathionine beta-lyase [Anaerotaenia torta]|uniref:MalY/PatB family protein n=1 Tax=Anaerotaenia torta TaxID=433293 RepID=UPI003D1AB7C3
MPFAFDKVTDRRDSFSMKWDVGENELPMWVADMDFETAPAVLDALRRKVDRGIFGYTIVPEEYRQAVSGWWARRHQFPMEPDWILFATGVVPAISSIVRKMTDVGENVLIQPPVYNIFYNSIRNNGRNLLENKLIYRDGQYSIDFHDLERKLADPQTTLMILCNPHNPIGKVWDRDTLARIGELCAKYRVLVLSDEIHCDLTDPGTAYTPFASVSDLCAGNSITCTAPTKAFNLAGLQTASVVIPDPHIRHKVNRGLNTDEVAEPNAFAMEAAITAFTQGDAWLDELRGYIKENKNIAAEYIGRHIPQIQVIPSEATYLLWMDCCQITCDTSRLCEIIRDETGLYLSSGSAYGQNGQSFLRMNLGTQQSRVLDGLEKLRLGIQRYEELAAKHPCGIVI